jgi:4-carboxymuconolactone decarboxylase
MNVAAARGFQASLMAVAVFAGTSTPAASALPLPRTTSADDVRAVAPALADYDQTRLKGDVWKRPGLSPRDRSLVTLAVMVSRGQTAQLADQVRLGLDNGLKPAEISETLTHLAFYAGWEQAMVAVPVVREVFAQRHVRPADLPPIGGPRLALDEASEAQRATQVEAGVGPVSRGVVQYTGDVLFKDLWLRPALKPRDRSLVTVAALVANGQTAQLTPHLNRAMDNGLTQAEASEMFTQLAFYAGWPNVFSAMPVAKAVFESRPR